MPDRMLLVCQGTGCSSGRSPQIRAALEEGIASLGLAQSVGVKRTGCHGFCQQGPLVVVEPEGILYTRVKVEDAPAIARSLLPSGQPVEALCYPDPLAAGSIPHYRDIPFYQRQQRAVLGNIGRIDPEHIDDTIAAGGYEALRRALAELSPEQVVEEVKRSGLRGRGGAGFPTGRKWEFTRSARGDWKYVICNADEGDPGAFQDRSVMEGDPHSVLEGMVLAGYAVGATQGYVYIRAEYPLAIERLQRAITQARERGFLGKGILGSDFSFDIAIIQGAGAFVCGEETALIRSIEGKRGTPTARPPYPAVAGLHGKPTLINNVKTFVNVRLILTRGADWFRGIGTEQSPGTAVFSLTGKVANAGLIEVPMGITLREIVFDIGGGIPGGKALKAVQTGGPSGGCLPASLLDTPVDFDSLAAAGSIMGSGGMVVLDESTCMVDMARYFLDFTQKESCGQCSVCRLGTLQMLRILEDITRGKGKLSDLDLLAQVGEAVKLGSLCGLGRTAPNPVLSTLRYFRHEFEDHILEKRCAAGVCQELFHAPCMNACPCDVDVPAYVSLVGEGRYAEALVSHLDRHPFPSVCARVCPHPCEDVCRRGTLDDPVAIRTLKRFMADSQLDLNYAPEILQRPEGESKSVAVVGAGPAGLSAAYFLARLGHRVTVFEAMPEPGGMLRYGIPEYRLPKRILDVEIERIRTMGVEIRTGARLGVEVSLEALRDQFDAVFVSVGAGRDTGAPRGLDGDGAVPATGFLREVSLGERTGVRGKVAVIGGGNTAVDAARTALRLGADQVTILYRRTRHEMPALPEEIEGAEEEGVRFEFLAAPARFDGDGEAGGRSIVCQRMALGAFDASGRRRPMPVPGDEFAVEADLVLLAVGQAPATEAEWGVATRSDGAIEAERFTLETSVPGVFAGGDVVLGPANVVQAVAQGKRAAEAIERHLNPQSNLPFPWRARKPLDTRFDPEADPSPNGRVQPALLAPGDRRSMAAEVEQCVSEASARCEAARCLRCDYGKTVAQR